ncbi:hypothetical protein F442_01413 [Phytophthora nicotianae P10297]|uniref:Uncharacterized protein n=1 Tax=Phytophthora nicotianae P10297 TaxID=1317064 RepID=W3A5C7_PHYNI|nr:hypothetical protein F442_01413 [Phytophthora nicotianae P10297]
MCHNEASSVTAQSRRPKRRHSHLEFARKLRQSLEEANETTWLDLMDPSGI